MKLLRFCLVLPIAIAACGRQAGPVEIPPDQLPFSVARSPSPSISAGPAQTFAIYFVRDGRLVRVLRETTTDAPPAEAALRGLLDGPSPAERARGIVSGLPIAVRLLGVVVLGGTAHVDLSGEFQEPAPPEAIAVRVAEVVWTLTESPEISSVRLSIDGEEVGVSRADGSVIDRPVTREDYATFAPI